MDGLSDPVCSHYRTSLSSWYRDELIEVIHAATYPFRLAAVLYHAVIQA